MASDFRFWNTCGWNTSAGNNFPARRSATCTPPSNRRSQIRVMRPGIRKGCPNATDKTAVMGAQTPGQSAKSEFVESCDPTCPAQTTMAGEFVSLPGREGEAPAEPHTREQGFLKVAAQPELRPPNRTDFPDGPSGQPCSNNSCRLTPRDSRRSLELNEMRKGAHPSSPRASSTDRNAFCGMSTSPNDFIRFLPSFCFSSSLRLRLISPP
jgi:hypothetical protein